MHVTTEPPRQLGKWALLLLALLFLFEGAVNIYTFRFLREPGITTVVIGLALAFLIPFGGFRSGQVLKAKGKTLIERILPLVLILASVSLILVVANGRKFAIEARHLNPRLVQETFMIFLFMNVLFFIFAFYDGYANSYTYPHLQKAYNELKRRKRQYMNRRALLEKAFAKMLGEVKTLQESANELSVAYRRANREVRGNISPSELPKYFHTDFNLPIEFPKEIESYLQKPEPLNEYCNELKTREKAFSDGQEYLDQIDDIFNKGK